MRLVLASLLLVGCREDAPPPADAAIDAPGVPETCDGACRTTAITAMFQSTRVLDRAVYGVTAADSTLHVEVYGGADPGCPSETSTTPAYTLVLADVAPPTGPAPTSSHGNVLDFVGDLLGGELGAQATMAIVRAVAAKAGEHVALDVELEFATGTVAGHLFATHCTSLDSI